ncbi:MAG: DUF2334 domain-containing protein [Verrucomicrobiota bacterium]
MNKHLIVSLHDVHPGNIEIASRQVQFCEKLGIRRFSILAIPHYHHERKLNEDAAMLRWLDERSRAGDDIVLHGFYHDRKDRAGGNFFFTKIYTANEAEFLDLPENEFKGRLTQGAEIWKKQGWALNGFIAPAWLMPLERDATLREFGFSYTTRLKTIHDLKKQIVTPSQSLCYSTRSWWRVDASLLWNPFLFCCVKKLSVMRVSLHPGDFFHPYVVKQIEHLLRLALAGGFQPLSYAEYVAL